NKDGISNLRPFVISMLPEIQEKESNDEPSAEAVPLTLPVVVNGTLKKSGDVDGWPIELAAAQTLVATADAFQRLGSPMDTTLQLVDARGFVVAQNDDAFGMDSQLVFKSPRAQRYFLRIFAFPSEPNSSIRFSSGSGYHYRISVVADQVALTWEPAAVT